MKPTRKPHRSPSTIYLRNCWSGWGARYASQTLQSRGVVIWQRPAGTGGLGDTWLSSRSKSSMYLYRPMIGVEKACHQLVKHVPVSYQLPLRLSIVCGAAVCRASVRSIVLKSSLPTCHALTRYKTPTPLKLKPFTNNNYGGRLQPPPTKSEGINIG